MTWGACEQAKGGLGGGRGIYAKSGRPKEEDVGCMQTKRGPGRRIRGMCKCISVREGGCRVGAKAVRPRKKDVGCIQA